METNFIKLKNLFSNSENRLKIFIVIGVIGVALILLSELVPGQNTKEKETNNNDYSSYVSCMEERTEEILSSIEGAGKCKVMITISDTSESVYAKNTEESGGDGNYSTASEYVLYDGTDGDTPMLVKQYFPKIQGIVVVCQGADDDIVRESIISSVSSLFDVPTNKITVSKIKG